MSFIVGDVLIQKVLSYFSDPPEFLRNVKNILHLSLFLSITLGGWRLLAKIVELVIASYIFFKKPIAFDTVITKWYFLLLFVIALYLAFFGPKKVLSIIKIHFKDFGGLSRFNNSYFIATVIISFVILSAGLAIIQNMYAGDLPKEMNLSPTGYSEGKLMCTSISEYDAWVVGDQVWCDLHFLGNKSYEFHEAITHITPFDSNETKKVANTVITCVDNKVEETTCHNIIIPVLYDTKNIVSIEIDDGQSMLISFSFRGITMEEYKKQRYEVFSLIFLLVSVGVFSVVSAMRNIQQMLEEPLKKGAKKQIRH